jgi:hypothetical protein
MINLVTAPSDATADRWTVLVGLFGLTIVVGLLASALILSVREALKERHVTARRIDDVRSQVRMMTARRRQVPLLPDVTPSVSTQRIHVSGRAGATMPGRRQDAPDATVSRDRSAVT